MSATVRAGRRVIDRGEHRARSGQALVEFAVALPVFVLLLFGMLEFGFAFNHHLTLEYATREGARTGAALANLGGGTPCASSTVDADAEIIAAVQRVLTSNGAPVAIGQVTRIRIYKALTDNSGDPNPSYINTWIPGASTHGSLSLLFKQSGITNWTVCSRDNGVSPDSLGVSIDYTYQMTTPLGALMRAASYTSIPMTDRTVMALNPS